MKAFVPSCLLLCLPLLGPAGAAELPAGIDRLEMETPRPYGYVIGDLIEMTVIVETAPGLILDDASLPRAGAVNRWLNLRRVEVRGDEHRHRLHLQYQTFHAPLEVKNLAIPGFALDFKGARATVQAQVPDWTFTMAPIRELSALRAGGLEPMRPDAWPKAPATTRHRAAFLLCFVVALLALAGIGYFRGWLTYGGRGRHFAAAIRKLRRHPDDAADPVSLQQAYSAVHEAFNQTLGETLFIQGLAEFFARHPRYETVRPEIEAFFASSYALFFGSGEAPAFGLARLRELCRSCLRIERASR